MDQFNTPLQISFAWRHHMAVFWVNEAPKTIVVNGNHMEFHQYFLIYCKTRYLIHLTTCNEHILTTSDQNRNLIAHIMDSFDSFFHLFFIKLANELLQKKIYRTKPILSILFPHPPTPPLTHPHPFLRGTPQITKNAISLEQIEIIQFCLKMSISGDSPTDGWVYGLVDGCIEGWGHGESPKI